MPQRGAWGLIFDFWHDVTKIHFAVNYEGKQRFSDCTSNKEALDAATIGFMKWKVVFFSTEALV